MFSRAGRIFSTHSGLFFFNFLEIALIAWWLARGSLSTEDWFVDNECQNPEWQDTVWDGYDDAVKAAEVAYDYIMEIRTSVQYSRARHQLSPRQKRTLNIFETIYGKTLFDRRDPDYRQAGAQAYRRFDKILDVLIVIASLNDDNPQAIAHYHMFCDDDMFVPFLVDPQGQDWVLDARPVRDGGGTVVNIHGTCDNDGTANVLSYSWKAPYGRHYQTAYCPDWVEHWERYGALSAYRDSRGRSVPVLRGTIHITQIALSFMTPSVLHELTHSQDILGNDVLGDQDCMGRGVGGYGWPCITFLAQNHPDLAAKNADNFAYLVTALYLDYADWRDGLGLRD